MANSENYRPFNTGYSNIPPKLADRVGKYRIDDSFQNVPLVFSCCDVIGSAISGVPFTFYTAKDSNTIDMVKNNKVITKDGRTDSEWFFDRGKRIKGLVEDNLLTPVHEMHPVNNLFNPPRAWEIETASKLIYLTLVSALVSGEVFWLFDFKNGIPINIDLGSSYEFTPKEFNGRLSHWVQSTVNSKGKNINRNWKLGTLLQHKLPNIYSKYRGLSPIKAGRLTIEQWLNIAVWNAGLFKEGVRPPIVIETDQAIHGKQYKEFIRNIVEKFSGFLKGHHPLTLTRGAKAKVLFNEREIDFMKSLELTKEEITTIYHVPPAMVNIFRWANYANAKIQKEVFWELGNLPRMMWLKQNIQAGILDLYFPGVVMEWDWASVPALRPDPIIVSETQKLEAETVAIYKNNVGMELSDIALIMNKPLLADIIVSDTSKPEAPEIELVEVEEEVAMVPQVYSSKGLVHYEQPEGFLEAYSKQYRSSILDPMSKKLGNVYVNFVDNMFEHLRGQLHGKATAIFHDLEWSIMWEDLTRDIIEKAFNTGITKMKVELTQPEKTFASFSWEKLHDLNGDFSGGEKLDLRLMVTELNRKQGVIQNTINEVRAVQALSGRPVEEVLPHLERVRSKLLSVNYVRVGRSNIGFAYHIGRYVSMKKFNVVKHIWVASEDVKRQEHKDADGEEVLLDTVFKSGLRYPYDPTGRMDNVYNCQCTTLPSIAKLESGNVRLLV